MRYDISLNLYLDISENLKKLGKTENEVFGISNNENSFEVEKHVRFLLRPLPECILNFWRLWCFWKYVFGGLLAGI